MNMKALSININSLISTEKCSDLRLLIEDIRPTVVLIQETHLKTFHRRYFDNYKFIRNDSGVGTGVLIKDSIQHSIIPFNNNVISATIISIQSHDSHGQLDKIALVSIYIPGNSGQCLQQALDDLFDALTGFSHFIIGGDFNSRHPFWGDNVTNVNGNNLFDWYQNNLFRTDITSPGEPTFPRSSSHIDFFLTSPSLTSSSVQQQNYSCVTLDAISDHFSVLLALNIINFNPIPDIQQHPISFKNTNWKHCNRELVTITNSHSIPNDVNLSNFEIDNQIEFLTNALNTCMINHSSIQKIRSSYKNISSDTLNFMKTRKIWKRQLKRIFHSNGNRLNSNYLELSARISCLSKIIKDKIRIDLNENLKTRLRNLKPSPMVFKEINRITGRKNKSNPSEIPIVFRNSTLSTDSEKVIAFQNFFTDLYSNQNLRINPVTAVEIATSKNAFLAWNNNPTISFFSITNKSDLQSSSEFVSTDFIKSTIMSLNNKKSSGPDKISNFFLKKCCNSILKFLTIIINNCLNNFYFPNMWKEAVLLPIKKKGSSNDIENFRPISLLSNLGKILERAIYRQIETFCQDNNIIPNTQFGFKKLHSTEHAIMYLENIILENLRKRECTVTCSLDLKKAFDSVWHDGLISKMISLNFPTNSIKIISNFLSNRSFKVKIGSTFSEAIQIFAGIPQGSFLGPFLYNIFIHDLPSSLGPSQSIQYADDTVIFASSERPHDALNFIKSHVERLVDYFNHWGISINYQKSELICFRNASPRGHHLAVRESKQLKLSINGNLIPLKKQIKYLGINFHERLRMNPHARIALNKSKAAAAQLKFLFRSSFVDISTKLLLYKTLIRPILSYGFISWFKISPTVAKELQIFERYVLRFCINKHRRPGGKWYKNAIIYGESNTIPLLSYLFDLVTKRIRSFSYHDNPLIRNVYSANIEFAIEDRYYASPISLANPSSSQLFQLHDNEFLSDFYGRGSPNVYRG